ncbi:MAG TPA: ABC transporter permease [Chthoniobacterales bacterium]|nr:ABC transporter permease [Chthoniobacterales bacterium]
MNDLRYAFRMLAKSPAFSAVAILTLALGVGANTAIFSVVEGTLLHPLPFPHAERLVRIYEAQEASGARGASVNLSELTVERWRESSRDIFEGIGAATGVDMTVGLSDGAPAQTVSAARISANFFSVLGLPPALGRTFTVEEDRPGGPAVALISDDFWRHTLNARPDVLGRSLTLDGRAYTIVGVMPKAFRHPYRASLWVPLAAPPPVVGATASHYLYGVGRLRPGVTSAQAEAALRGMCAAINQTDPNPMNPRAAYLPPLRESFVMDLRPKILVIVGAALCALVIAAANFAGLLLARVIERKGEFALRAALGASRARLIRQQLAQALVLAVLGTALGLLVASWLTPALIALSPEGADATGSAMREFDNAVRLDLPVFAFAAGVMLCTGLGFGLLPAIRAARTDLRGAMSAASRSATLDRSTRRLLGSFVVVELAIAAVLLTASITATQYFEKLINEPWGFETQGRVQFNCNTPERLFRSPAAELEVLNAALAQLRSLPGVISATLTSPAPLNPPRDLMSFNPEGVAVPEPRGFYMAYERAAAPDYFKNMGQRLLHGREFLESDTADASPVCIVTEAFARRFWPEQDAIGRRVKWGRLDGPRPWLIVVGVVADVKVVAEPADGEVIGTITRPIPQMLATDPGQFDEITFVVQSKGEPLSADIIRVALARADTRLAAFNIVALEEAAGRMHATERFISVLVSAFGLLGLVLAAVGLYGLLSLQVARRQREFGIRSALGATAAQIVRLVAKQGASLLLIGLFAGGLGTLGLVRLMRSQWAKLPAPNVLAVGGGGFVLCLAVALACWLPARRASRIDPVIALRAE